MSLTFKLGSLAVRTLAKPLANYIKRNAREHERFRKIAVNFAQRLHRIDMRMRLGLLQDPAAIDRQIARELKEAEKKRQQDAIPTVKTEAEIKAEEAEKKEERKHVEEHVKSSIKPPRIRPLSEAKAIDSGANFIAETFLFIVAGGLILLEAWRRDRKDKKQDADVNQKLEEAEKEREEMKVQMALLKEEIDALLKKKPFDPAAARTRIEAITHAETQHHREEQEKAKLVTQSSKIVDAPKVEVAKPVDVDKGPGTAKAAPPASTAAPVEDQEAPANRTSMLFWLPDALWKGGKGSNPPSS
ncbi:hypothetical protein FKW77_010688 [Venturia effusa]|uniref:OPA3-like protein n=1 Tax=Venturia effusa TaxID=50376 RepID=A0A517KY67_9PEZI|nr:hypothetical protein FKW77_010688 [Venturia effusa]